MLPITLVMLQKLVPGIKAPRAFLDALNRYLPIYEINTRYRLAAFFAQTGHESWSYNKLEEKASGAAYEGRKDLGNKFKGDGVKYKGRGIIQLTGRENYTKFAAFSKIDVVNHPEKLLEEDVAVLAACWYWHTRNLNNLADNGLFDAITKKINGGYNGKKDRDQRYAKALEVLKG